MTSSIPSRIASIDILRALTMLLMIFVNDLWSLSGIPEWLGHARWDEDRMGLADVVFPAFLFIVGLSIPYAIKARERKGDSRKHIIVHILARTFTLVVMGLFMVNLENINAELIPINKQVWQILMTLAFFLIWNLYPNNKAFGTVSDKVMMGLGIAILIYLAFIYQGGTAEQPTWMQTHWWGILGLIGWAYGLSALIYLFIGDRAVWFGVACLIMYLLNVQEFVSPFSFDLRLFVSASNYACVMSGVLATVLYIQMKDKGSIVTLVLTWLGVVLILLAFGFGTRPVWGISKIMATPSWTAICSGITLLTFVALFWITDRMGLTRWAKILEPAGRSTLTCYLIPYFVYALMVLTDFDLPNFFTFGYVGILKSLLFGMIIIYITGLLERFFQIRLKI